MKYKYNELNEGEQRLCVVKFEIQHGEYPHGLIHKAMERINPTVSKTLDALPEHHQLIKEAAIDIEDETNKMLKDLGLC